MIKRSNKKSNCKYIHNNKINCQLLNQFALSVKTNQVQRHQHKNLCVFLSVGQMEMKRVTLGIA